MKKLFQILLLTLVVIFSCKPEQKEEEKKKTDDKELTESLIKMNQNQTKLESELIDAYVKRHKWDVTKTGTGLRYLIYKEGYGAQAKNGNMARVDFTIILLNGKECYSTKESGPIEFLIGEDNVESGLHEGITYMKVGDKAKIIIPSHLAYGLIGDSEKIPPMATIIYDIELLALK